MTRDSRRITLISTSINTHEWDCSNECPSRVIFVKSFSILEHALSEAERDVERVVIDHAGTAAQFLELLSRLPNEFHGDLLYITLDGSAFLSARVRGDGRTLFALSASDAEFYLSTYGLIPADDPMSITVQTASRPEPFTLVR